MLKIPGSGVSESTRSRLLFLAGALLFAVLVAGSSLAGTPHDAHGAETLPGVALGWTLLFHIERASAVLGAAGVTLLIAWRGAHGEWPIKFANLEYAPKATVQVTVDVIDALTDRLDAQNARLRELEDRRDQSPRGDS